MFLTEVSYKNLTELLQVGKVLNFQLLVDNLNFGQTTGG